MKDTPIYTAYPIYGALMQKLSPEGSCCWRSLDGKTQTDILQFLDSQPSAMLWAIAMLHRQGLHLHPTFSPTDKDSL